jgi:NADPH:quinone reductase-like Zn-dependent oxidoreductase
VGADVSTLAVGDRVWAVTTDGRAFGAGLGSAAESALFEASHVTLAPAGAGSAIGLVTGARIRTFLAQPPNTALAEAARHVEEKSIRR